MNRRTLLTALGASLITGCSSKATSGGSPSFEIVDSNLRESQGIPAVRAVVENTGDADGDVGVQAVFYSSGGIVDRVTRSVSVAAGGRETVDVLVFAGDVNHPRIDSVAVADADARLV